MTSVILVSLLAQPRIFYTMAIDGLLPPIISRVHPHHQTPYTATIISGIMCSILAGILPIDMLAELTSVGTLLAFAVVCFSVIVLRRKEPHRHCEFRVPGGYIIPLLGGNSCLLFSSVLLHALLYIAFLDGCSWDCYFVLHTDIGIPGLGRLEKQMSI